MCQLARTAGTVHAHKPHLAAAMTQARPDGGLSTVHLQHQHALDSERNRDAHSGASGAPLKFGMSVHTWQVDSGQEGWARRCTPGEAEARCKHCRLLVLAVQNVLRRRACRPCSWAVPRWLLATDNAACYPSNTSDDSASSISQIVDIFEVVTA